MRVLGATTTILSVARLTCELYKAESSEINIQTVHRIAAPWSEQDLLAAHFLHEDCCLSSGEILDEVGVFSSATGNLHFPKSRMHSRTLRWRLADHPLMQNARAPVI